ncbi:hypothetical protein ACRAWF_06595 [Streptomyces sp. L7]
MDSYAQAPPMARLLQAEHRINEADFALPTVARCLGLRPRLGQATSGKINTDPTGMVTIYFDLDGTLTNPKPGITRARSSTHWNGSALRCRARTI